MTSTPSRRVPASQFYAGFSGIVWPTPFRARTSQSAPIPRQKKKDRLLVGTDLRLPTILPSLLLVSVSSFPSSQTPIMQCEQIRQDCGNRIDRVGYDVIDT